MDFAKEGTDDANAHISLSRLIDHLKLLKNSDGSSSDHVKLEGKNTGATADIHYGPSGGDTRNCYGINIYVNNNVQGVNNSIVLGSEVSMNNPGVHLSLSFKDMNMQKGPRKKRRNHLSVRELNMKKRSSRNRQENKDSWFDQLRKFVFMYLLVVFLSWVLF